MQLIMEQYDYNTVTIRNICKVSGVSYGSFYNLFDSKEDFLTYDFTSYMDCYYETNKEFEALSRMDIVVDYGEDQFIIELKIWHGSSKHKNAYDQVCGYLERKNLSVGYLLTFDFRKEVNKQPGLKWVDVNGKRIFDVIV